MPRPGARASATAPTARPRRPRRGPAPPPRPQMLLLLLLLLVISWPPSGDAVSLAEQRRPGLPGPSDTHPEAEPDPWSRELRMRYEDLRARLRGQQSSRDAAPGPAPAVRILSPELRLGSDGHLHLRLSRASLTEGLPEAYRVHRALLPDRGCVCFSTLHCAGDFAVESESPRARGCDVNADSGGRLDGDRDSGRRPGVDLDVNARARRSPGASRARAPSLPTGEPGPATTADVCQARCDLLNPT
ncbi:Hypothetical predicted protein [Marmota monax]|uniref:TGF-beta propeptide domain-containing protein n=1 Tax=Marmota monax TaxID=9995 RepID=A0A5E4AC07_MARMO|nr:Hypothetical predicted protein [Marmota monax]